MRITVLGGNLALVMTRVAGGGNCALRSQSVSVALGDSFILQLPGAQRTMHCDTNTLARGPSLAWASPEMPCELLGTGARPRGETCPDNGLTLWSVRNPAFPLRPLWRSLLCWVVQKDPARRECDLFMGGCRPYRVSPKDACTLCITLQCLLKCISFSKCNRTRR